MCEITVFTPTYNRAELLPRLYRSLIRQSVADFEWIIVDDGSTDHTEDVVRRFGESQLEFPITYLKKENGGKHTAINTGLEQAKGRYFFIVDSDDWLPDDSVETIIRYVRSLPEEEPFAGVGGLKSLVGGEAVGASFSGEYVDCTSLERPKYGIMGDKAEVFRTDILRKYPFPIFPGESFVTETVVWYRIAYAGYKIRWFNENVYFCEYLPGGLTQTRGKYLRNFGGFMCRVHDELKYKEIPWKQKLKLVAQCGAYAMIRKESLRGVSRSIGVPVSVLLPLGLLARVCRRFV